MENIEKHEQFLAEQKEFQHRIQRDLNLNIVTCGNCGTVIIHEINEEDIYCGDCDRDMPQSDCPDLYY